MYIYIYKYVLYICVCIYIYIYIYIKRERETERERERERERGGERKILTGSESTLLHLVSLEVFIILLECNIFLFFLSFIFNVCLFTWLQ